jgi:hypothetical protein
VSSNIRSRVDENIGVSNSILYGIGKKISAVVQTLIVSRTIGNAYRYKSLSQPTVIPYNITVQEQRLEGGVDINYQDSDNLNGSVGIRLGERDERHVLEKIDGVDKNIQENRSQQEQRWACPCPPVTTFRLRARPEYFDMILLIPRTTMIGTNSSLLSPRAKRITGMNIWR